MYFGHGSILKWSERQDFHLRPRGPKPRALKTELRSDETGGSEGTRTLSLPADNGLLWLVELRIHELVGGAGNAPVVTSSLCFGHRFYRPAAGTPPKLVAGVGITPT